MGRGVKAFTCSAPFMFALHPISNVGSRGEIGAENPRFLLFLDGGTCRDVILALFGTKCTCYIPLEIPESSAVKCVFELYAGAIDCLESSSCITKLIP